MKESGLHGVEMMLEEWAAWSRKGIDSGLGFSRLSNIGWLVETGGYIIHINGPRYIEDNPIAEEMDEWLLELQRELPSEAEAIFIYYLTGWMKDRVAQKLRISIRSLQEKLYKGKIWLSGRYSAKKSVFGY